MVKPMHIRDPLKVHGNMFCKDYVDFDIIYTKINLSSNSVLSYTFGSTLLGATILLFGRYKNIFGRTSAVICLFGSIYEFRQCDAEILWLLSLVIESS